MASSTGVQPAARGLHGSGYVVSVVRADSPIESYISEDGAICLVLPGKPCAVLLGFPGEGVKPFLAHLIARLQEVTHDHG